MDGKQAVDAKAQGQEKMGNVLEMVWEERNEQWKQEVVEVVGDFFADFYPKSRGPPGDLSSDTPDQTWTMDLRARIAGLNYPEFFPRGSVD